MHDFLFHIYLQYEINETRKTKDKTRKHERRKTKHERRKTKHENTKDENTKDLVYY